MGIKILKPNVVGREERTNIKKAKEKIVVVVASEPYPERTVNLSPKDGAKHKAKKQRRD